MLDLLCWLLFMSITLDLCTVQWHAGILSDGSWIVKSLQVLLAREVLHAECASVTICGLGVSPAKVSEYASTMPVLGLQHRPGTDCG